MCGRYTLTADKSTIEKRFGAKFYIAQPAFDYAPTFNAAPSQLLPIIRTYHEDRIELAKWGFVREDWNNSRIRPQNNARVETAQEKPMFSASFRGRHCLVLADSFYEWQTLANGKKQPYRIMLKSGEPFAMAGIYARGSDHGLGDAENASVIPYSDHASYEVDHLISLELGGSNDISNLWPEPHANPDGSFVKDTFENYLHARVCRSAMTIQAAQAAIASNWITAYNAAPHTPATPSHSAENIGPADCQQILVEKK